MPTTIQHIPDELITKALALTGKKIWDMEEHIDDWNGCYECWISTKSEFSMRVFCYYLLSPEFLIAYNHRLVIRKEQAWWADFWGAIADFQFGDTKPLIELLKKI